MPDDSRTDTLTVLVVGAGAVENAWSPVLRALQHYFDFPLTSDGANSFLARVVYLSRWHATLPASADREPLARFPDLYREVCDQIRAELQAAESAGELRVRAEFDSIVNHFLREPRTRFGVISTNWDTVVETALNDRFRGPHRRLIEASHIHGSIWNEDPLYLPTELIREAYRPVDQHHLLGGLQAGAMEALDHARRVVLYGLSLSPLDAELCQTLGSGWSNSTLESIDIVVPKSHHETVAHRVNMLIDLARSVRVTAYDPADLRSGFDFTIARPQHNHHAPEA